MMARMADGIAAGMVDGAPGQRRLVTRYVDGVGVDVGEALDAALAELRTLSSREQLRADGIDVGFRIEDLLELEVWVPGEDRDAVVARLRRILRPAARIVLRSAAQLRLRGTFAERGGAMTRTRYAMEAGRVRVEAFELHVVEHCNLRCAHCCNMSPYLDDKTLSVAEIDAQLRGLAQHLHADVFKIMGGEPLLHPDITEILRVIPRTGIADTVRLFTNGLLLKQMRDDFWEALDHLTVSSYASAPVKPAHLDELRAKARRFGVILNVKQVDQFSEVMCSHRRAEDDPVTQATYDACWLRDRCLVVRGGRFFKCTRAAYVRELKERITLTGVPYDEGEAERRWAGDGVPLTAPDLAATLLTYMNDPRPLDACRACRGSSGDLVPHTQLTRRQIEAGHL